jgi:hypothetical protein
MAMILISVFIMPIMVYADDTDDAEATSGESNGLNIVADSMSQRTVGSNSDIDIARYNFFSEEGNIYKEAEQNEKTEDAAMMRRLFTEDSPAKSVSSSVVDEVLQADVFEKVTEYNQGLYDEENEAGYRTVIIVAIFALLSGLSFFVTRGYYSYKKRRGN